MEKPDENMADDLNQKKSQPERWNSSNWFLLLSPGSCVAVIYTALKFSVRFSQKDAIFVFLGHSDRCYTVGKPGPSQLINKRGKKSGRNLMGSPSLGETVLKVFYLGQTFWVPMWRCVNVCGNTHIAWEQVNTFVDQRKKSKKPWMLAMSGSVWGLSEAENKWRPAFFSLLFLAPLFRLLCIAHIMKIVLNGSYGGWNAL